MQLAVDSENLALQSAAVQQYDADQITASSVVDSADFHVPTAMDANATWSYNESSAGGSDLVLDWGARFVPYTAVSIACLLFNAVSLAALALFVRGPKTVHHRLLTNLAVCDLVGTVLLWLYHNSPYIFPRFQLTGLRHCLFVFVVLLVPIILSLSASSLSLLMLAVNQYIAICSPLFAQTRITVGRAGLCVLTGLCVGLCVGGAGLCVLAGLCVGLCVLAAWLTAATAASLPLFLMLSMQARDVDCAAYSVDMAVKSIEVCGYMLAGLILVIISLYARIYREVLECRRRTAELRNNSSNSARRPLRSAVSTDTRTTTVSSRGTTTQPTDRRRSAAETNYKAFMTTLLLTGTLVLFWLPYMVFQLLTAHVNYENIPDVVYKAKFYVVDFLPMLNFITDPIIYGIRMRDIRRAYRRMVLGHATTPNAQRVRWYSVSYRAASSRPSTGAGQQHAT